MLILVALILSGFMVAVIFYDARYYIIPNWLNAALLLIYPVWYFVAPAPLDVMSALIMFGILFTSGFIMFALRIMGGGDVKLLAVCGLYMGCSAPGLHFVIYTALLGGLLSIVLIASRLVVPIYYAKSNRADIPLIFTMGGPVPYGLAIAGAFLMVLWLGKMPGLPLDLGALPRL